MKNSETDRELVDLIVKTLRNHEEQYILGSWENFVNIRNRRKRYLILFTFTGIAATLLIGWIGFRILLSDTLFYGGTRLKHEQAILRTENFKKRNPATANAKDEKKKSSNVESEATYRENSASAGKSDNSSKPSGVNTGETGSVNAEEKKENRKESISINILNGLSFHYASVQPDDLMEIQRNVGSQNSFVNNIDEKDLSSDENNLPVNNHSHRLRFGVNISPGVTSTSTVSSFNYSGGISADIKLTENLSVSTGVQLEHQNAVNRLTDSPSWIPAGKLQAILTNLDLPLNITWKFLKKGSARYYLTSGISSVAYLSERYVNTSYSQKITQVVNMAGSTPNVSYLLSTVQNTTRKTGDPLNTFDFAGRVNVIIGFEQPLSSNLYLHIEPFVKIPVTGFTSEHIKFTTSGIVCKISF